MLKKVCVWISMAGVAAICTAIPGAAQAEDAVSADGKASCEALAAAEFSDIEDAPAQINSAQLIEAKDTLPSYCKVNGYVWPQVGFELRLPATHWNGKLIEIGCGGSCGHLGWTFWCPLHRGYACVVSDMGHTGEGELWAYHNMQAQIDNVIRAPHVTALAGKAISARYYRRTAQKAFFMGCSTGGNEALSEAEHFPWDFDGIIAIAGVPYMLDYTMGVLWTPRALRGADGRSLLSSKDLQLLHAAALTRCDRDDGVKDGIIGNPYQCGFDPATLACKPGQNRECLTEAQIEAVRKVYAGPKTSRGERFLRGLAPGSELFWADAGDTGNTRPYDDFKYTVLSLAPGSKWTPTDFDFDHDFKRLDMSAALSDESNTDLRKFRGAGGKLLLVQGWSDTAAVPQQMIEYYETMEKTLGGRAQTQKFSRLFAVPGMTHCSGGDGAFAIDYLTYLEDWVERGRAPDMLIGAHVDSDYLRKHSTAPGHDAEPENPWAGAMLLKFPLDAAIPVTFTRPIYPYPSWAKYRGTGDPNSAENFRPATP